MSKINTLLTEANGNLAKSKEMIVDAIREAEGFVFPLFKIDWDIDIVVSNRLYNILIPEDGVGGRTHASDFIEFGIDEEKATKDLISEMTAHELCHAARWGKNSEWIDCLFDGLIFEGLATYFEYEYIKEREEKGYFIKKIIERSDEENEMILSKLRGQLDLNNHDYQKVFFTGDDELPRWSGYSLGFYLVKKYLEKTGRKIEDVFAEKYDEFRVVL